MEAINFIIKEGLNDNIHLLIPIDYSQYEDCFATTVYLPSYRHKHLLSKRKTVLPFPKSMTEFLNEIDNYVTIITIIDPDTLSDLNDFTAIGDNKDTGIFRVVRKKSVHKDEIENEPKYLQEPIKSLFEKFGSLVEVSIIDVEKVDNTLCPVGVIIKKIEGETIETITAVLPELDNESFVSEFKKLAEKL